MPTALRVLPGLTALTLSFLAAYVFATNLGLIFEIAANLQFFFTLSHIGSALLCVSVPITFALVGRNTGCRRGLLKLGTILLASAALPLLIANGIYLAAVTPQAVGNDIGGFGLMMLGAVALLSTSLVFTFALPAAHPADADRLENRSTRGRR